MQKLKNFFILNLGVFFLSVGIYFFKFPNNFSTGGVSGLSVIFAPFFPNISSSTIMLIINFLFLGLGFLFLDKKFGFKTIYCTIVLSILTQLFEIYFPLTKTLTSQKMLELTFSVILPAVGSALIFLNEASSGGTDIIAMILKKYTNFNIGKALLCTDFFIAGATLFVFNVETFLFSVLGLTLKSFMLDIVIENISTKKIATIITVEKKLVNTFITEVLKRGATIWEGIGGYTNENKAIILTALTRSQALELKKYVKYVDSKAFIVIKNSTEIIGKGFNSGF